MYAAFGLRNAVDAVTRHRIEARVLARETPEAIAAKAGLRPDVVRCYEAVFFDVRPHLENIDYVMNQVLDVGLGGGELSYDVAWKYFGFFGGPDVLDLVMGVPGGARPSDPAEAADFLADHTRETLACNAAVAVRALRPQDRRAAAEFLKLYARLVGGHGQAAQNSGGSAIQRNIQAALEALPFVAGRDGKDAVPPELAPYEHTAAELRAHEQFQVAFGMETPEIMAVKDMKFPEPGSSPRPG
jgi:hypothetical protein